MPSLANEEELSAVAHAVNHCCAGGGGDFFREDEQGVTQITMEPFTNDSDDDMEISVLDRTVTVDVGQMLAPSIRPSQPVNVETKGVVPFVVLKFTPGVDRHWSIPPPGVFHDLINRVEGKITDDKLDCGSACRWANLWGKVGLLGLDPRDQDKVERYRAILENQILGHTRFTIYPKDLSLIHI